MTHILYTIFEILQVVFSFFSRLLQAHRSQSAQDIQCHFSSCMDTKNGGTEWISTPPPRSNQRSTYSLILPMAIFSNWRTRSLVQFILPAISSRVIGPLPSSSCRTNQNIQCFTPTMKTKRGERPDCHSPLLRQALKSAYRVTTTTYSSPLHFTDRMFSARHSL